MGAVARSHCSVEDRNYVAVAVESGLSPGQCFDALHAVALSSTREECFWVGYSLAISGMSRLSAT